MVLRYDVPPDSSCAVITRSTRLRDKLFIKSLCTDYSSNSSLRRPPLEAIIGKGLRGQREPRALRSMMRGSSSVLGNQLCTV